MKKVLTIASTSLSLVPSGGISICHNIGTSGFSKMSIVSNKVTLWTGICEFPFFWTHVLLILNWVKSLIFTQAQMVNIPKR
jgi:hypothetical protein